MGPRQAIEEAVKSSDALYDCGFISATARVFEPELAHGTLRLLRFSSNYVADPQPAINTAFEKEGRPVPSYNAELINHDPFFCRVISPCPRCRRNSTDDSEGN